MYLQYWDWLEQSIMLKEKDKNFLFKWFSSLFTVWYASIGLYLYDPYILQIIYWPLHTHDIEIDVVESTVDWQSYIDKLDNYEVATTDSEEIIIEPVTEEPDSLMIKLRKYISE